MKSRHFMFNLQKTVFFLLIFFFHKVFADDFENGRRLLASGHPDTAIPLLARASKKSGVNPQVHLYLGVAYFRVGRYDESLSCLAKGKNIDIMSTYLYCYNIGNALAAQNRLAEAESSFTESILINPSFPSAFLNRANLFLKSGKYDRALEDYKAYLTLNPQSSQRQPILKMIEILEHKKKESIQAAIAAEEHRAAEEARYKASVLKYKNFMDEINASLSSIEDADTVSVGAEETIDYLEENDLD